LSNGQVKKLIILKKLLDSIPRYLLLDYPFEGLDVQSRMELRDFLDHLTTTFGVQLIIADHEHPELPKVLTKKCLLDTNEVLISDFTIIKSTARINHVTYVPIKNKTEPVVEMQELKIQYGDKVILENLNWKINRGERWALTGKNGSGKTTLFSFIFADHPMAYSEKIFLFGKRRGTGESIWDIKKRISYLGPEQAHFLNYTTEQLTVAEFLQKTTNTNERLNNLIDFFQIKQLLSKKVKYLSNGQLQLVFLINLFHLQKELLLLDEPFQFLDPQHKKRVSEYLEAHLNESVTLVLITHYDSDVGQWTNHRMIL
jgi:molybdate transport system ATP-binding protein